MLKHDKTCREMSRHDAEIVKGAYDTQISSGHTPDTALNLATTVYLQRHPFEIVATARELVSTYCDRDW